MWRIKNSWAVSAPGVSLSHRGGKIGQTRWASPVRPKLGPGWAIKLLARKKSGQIWPGPVWPGPPEFFFALKILFGPIGPIFRAGWAVKMLTRKNRANFGPVRFWPAPPDCHLYSHIGTKQALQCFIIFLVMQFNGHVDPKLFQVGFMLNGPCSIGC